MEMTVGNVAVASAVSDRQVPAHVAIMMDGNGRWAARRGLPRRLGHREGAERLREIVAECADCGIRYLTVFAFSTENWRRGPQEVGDLMNLFRLYTRSEAEALVRNGVRFRFIGDHDALDATLVEQIRSLEARTRSCTALELTVAVNYGSRTELVRATRLIAEKVSTGTVRPDEIDEEMISKHLYAGDLPDPDLVIRTSGECRLSNFMLWQSAFSEFEFVDDLWPEFSAERFRAVLTRYSCRDRRFGAASN